jgi:hypothetical protein
MKTPLIFEATCNGHVFGVVVIEEGIATARVGRMVVSGVLFGHALMWVGEHNPDSCHEVEFRLVLDFGVPGYAGSGFTERVVFPHRTRYFEVTH